PRWKSVVILKVHKTQQDKITGESKSSKRGTAHEDETAHEKKEAGTSTGGSRRKGQEDERENPRHEIHRKASKTEDRFSGAREARLQGDRRDHPQFSRAFVRAHENGRRYINT
ncbi:hypothetical protein NPIL_176831, partial [Nephila pilipes]